MLLKYYQWLYSILYIIVYLPATGKILGTTKNKTWTFRAGTALFRFQVCKVVFFEERDSANSGHAALQIKYFRTVNLSKKTKKYSSEQ